MGLAILMILAVYVSMRRRTVSLTPGAAAVCLAASLFIIILHEQGAPGGVPVLGRARGEGGTHW